MVTSRLKRLCQLPQVLTKVELLPFKVNNRNKHLLSGDLTSFNTQYCELVQFDNIFIVEHSETSDNRPYTTSNNFSETSFNENDRNILQSDPNQSILQFNPDDNTDLFQNPQPQQQENITHDQQQNTTLRNQSDSSETDTIRNVSEKSDINNKNSQNFTTSNDSNVLQVPVRQETQNTNDNLTQDNTFTLSTSHITVTQPLHTQNNITSQSRSTSSSQCSPYTTPHNSPQQGSSNPTGTTRRPTQPEVQFQTITLTRQSMLQTLSYTPAQNTQTQNVQFSLTINTRHSNTVPNSITSRNLSRPPLQIIPNNPLSYSLINTIPNDTQHPSITNNQQNNNPCSTSHSPNILPNPRSQPSNLSYTTIRSNPQIITSFTQPSQIHKT